MNVSGRATLLLPSLRMGDPGAIISPSLSILIVEDDAQIRLFIRDVLEKQCNHKIVAEAITGFEMVQLAQLHKPDLIVFDIHLPGLDGLEALRQVNQERPTPSVAITGDRDDATLDRALEEHVLAYLAKPFTAQQLIPAVRVAWARGQELVALAGENQNLKQTLQSRKIIERAKGVIMKRHRWTESDAFRRLQRAAMNRRQTMADLAQAILNGEEIPL